MTGSLAYRKNESAILRGDVPEKYLRILPHIPHGQILELGAAEGVLALLLAKRGDRVIALERSRERWESALKLSTAWGFENPPAAFICGDITERLDLIDGIDTFVAVRSIYYLGNQLDEVFAEVAAKVSTVVLCGNQNRARWWFEGVPNKVGGPDNFYASAAGMRDLLTRHGYTITQEVTNGDPIVVGSR